MAQGVDPAPSQHPEPIAIIGMGCRFPGARGPAGLWRLLIERGDAIREVPKDRFNIDELYDPRPHAPGRLVTRWGGFLDDIDLFDPVFFGVAPKEAHKLDPQQRLLLEVGWEALEDAGIPPERLAETRTGIYVGSTFGDFENIQSRDRTDFDIYAYTGGARHALAGRLAHALGVRGPCMVIDTGCSASLVAIHLASQALKGGECGLALASGVNVILIPEFSLPFSVAGALSPDGRCKTFDARANGFVRSEGAATVVLKRLKDALADGDRIYAVVKGSAVNHDGPGPYMQPSDAGQQALLRVAYESAGVQPSQVQYLEAHGTGTIVGDPIEVTAAASVLAEGGDRREPLVLGSVKTNIGHTESAAGIAGVVKTALAIHHRQLPPNLHFETPNPGIPWDRYPLQVRTEVGEWPAPGRPLVAGVNSFGISGVNAHVILADQSIPKKTPHMPQLPLVLALSATSPEALNGRANEMKTALAAGGALSEVSFQDVCFTAGVRRSHYEQRLAIVAGDASSAAALLNDHLAGEARADVARGTAPSRKGRVAFIFPGQGSQWNGMVRGLRGSSNPFEQSLRRWDAEIRKQMGWSLLDRLDSAELDAWLDDMSFVQPALCAIQASLAEAWRAWGVHPDAVIGHSMGEVAAAFVAEAIGFEDAVRIICQRSVLVCRTRGQGGMLAVDLPLDEARSALAGYEDRVAIAVNNGPSATVLSGDKAALAAIAEKLTERDVFHRMLKVDYASHCMQMDPLREPILQSLHGVSPRTPSLRLVSTVQAPGAAERPLDAAYWWDNLRQPVLFHAATKHLMEEGFDVFLELSPHPVLTAPLAQSAEALRKTPLITGTLKREEDDWANIRRTMAALFTRGAPVDFTTVTPAGHVVSLPLWPRQGDRYPVIDPHKVNARSGSRAGASAHPLLQGMTRLAATSAWLFEGELNPSREGWLKDHALEDEPVLPATAMLEMALSAGRKALDSNVSAEDVVFRKALFVRNSARVQLTLREQGSGGLEFLLHTSTAVEGPFQLHCSGVLRPASPVATEADAFDTSESISGAEHYERCKRRGLVYGPAFQGVVERKRGATGCAVSVRAPQALGGPVSGYLVHPAVLDAGLQAVAGFLEASTSSGTLVPVGVRRATIYQSGVDRLTSWAVAREAPAGEVLADVFMRDEKGAPVATLEGVRLQPVAHGSEGRLEGQLFNPLWQEAALSPTSSTPIRRWAILTRGSSLGSELIRAVNATGASAVPIQAAGAEELRAELTAADGSWGGVVMLWPAEVSGSAESIIGEVQDSLCPTLVELSRDVGTRAPAPRIYVVTRQARAVVDGDAVSGFPQAALGGLARTMALERPELRCTVVDITDDKQVGALARELVAQDAETSVALRGERRFGERLTRVTLAQPGGVTSAIDVDKGAHFALVTDASGLDALRWTTARRRAPGPGQVEISVRAAALNFRDVAISIGLVEGPRGPWGPALGFDCGGVVTRVGAGVTRLRPGDEVMAVGRHTLASTLLTDARLATRKPANLDWDQAATAACVFCTASYGLEHVGRLAPGETVLIHTASGGVGMAAIQLAQLTGATVIATAGTEAKRDAVRGLGVEHVFDGRTLAFADGVMRVTGGRGVDVVLNSLAGEGALRSLALLKAYGRFIEMGKSEAVASTAIEFSQLSRNRSVSVIDLDAMVVDNPALLGKLLDNVAARLADGRLRPLPTRVFEAADAIEALRLMSRGAHTGKLALRMSRPSEMQHRAPPLAGFDETGSYLITGGLSGIGLEVARWAADRGAQHLVLCGRGEPTPDASTVIDSLRSRGVEVQVARADVSDAATVDALIAGLRAAPEPLRGVFHSAGVLDDATLNTLEPRQFRSVMAPKAWGTWRLHQATRDLELDFFVVFSSVAAVVGSPGQANYAAANALVDSLCAWRRAQGLPALSINWGPWSDVGLAARPDRGARLAHRGLGSYAPHEGIDVLQRIMGVDAAQLSAVRLDAEQWAEFNPIRPLPYFQRVLQERTALSESSTTPSSTRARVMAAYGPAREEVVTEWVRGLVGAILGMSASRVTVDKPLVKSGLDSLMAVELRNRIAAELGVTIPPVKILGGWNVRDVATAIVAQIPTTAEQPTPELLASPPITVRAQELLNAAISSANDLDSKLDSLSAEEVEELLRLELASRQ
nr:Beta-ketoacyl synthase [uncultured bacterium]